MPARNDTVRFLWFDPGAGATGWAAIEVSKRGLSPRRDWRDFVVRWGVGELRGSEHEMCTTASRFMWRTRFGEMPYVGDCVIGTEDYLMRPKHGGKELLSPVRINAVLDYECRRRCALTLQYQMPSERIVITKDKLRMWGLWRPMGKDAFAAMQHAVTAVRKYAAR